MPPIYVLVCECGDDQTFLSYPTSDTAYVGFSEENARKALSTYIWPFTESRQAYLETWIDEKCTASINIYSALEASLKG